MHNTNKYKKLTQFTNSMWISIVSNLARANRSVVLDEAFGVVAAVARISTNSVDARFLSFTVVV